MNIQLLPTDQAKKEGTTSPEETFQKTHKEEGKAEGSKTGDDDELD
jgi:hypothetical protein